MSLRRLVVLYAACTLFATVTPHVLVFREGTRRRALPVNSELPLEDPPPLVSGPAQSPCGSHISGGSGRRFSNCVETTGKITVAIVAVDPAETQFALRAYDSSGTVVWTTPIGEVTSGIAVDAEGTLYLVSRRDRIEDVAHLMSIDRFGSTRWSVEIGPVGWYPVRPALAPEGHVIALTGGSISGKARLFSFTTNGEMRWGTDEARTGSALLVGCDGRIFVGIDDGVIAFDGEGNRRWRFQSGGRHHIGGMVVGADGTLYLAARFIHAIDRAGQPRWEFKSERTYTDGDYFGTRPALAQDGTLYAVSYYRQLYAITPAGRKKWVARGDFRNGPRFDRTVLTKDGWLSTGDGYMRVDSGSAE